VSSNRTRTMRALICSFVIVLAAPSAALAQGDAAMAAARAVAGSTVGTQAKSHDKTPAASPSPAPSAKASDTKASPAPGAKAEETGIAALEPHGFTYKPEGRRDPFVNLLRRGSGIDTSAQTGPRPSGLKGLGTSEVTLKGTLASQGKYVAILQGVDSRAYVVHAGDKLFDGTVRSITADALVILQQVNDPLSTEKEREVRKVLRQTEEAR
jgi:Tfp pilus assembly protein PilP